MLTAEKNIAAGTASVPLFSLKEEEEEDKKKKKLLINNFVITVPSTCCTNSNLIFEKALASHCKQ